MVAKCMDDKKAEDIKVLDIGSLTTMADYFVVCHGNSSTQMKAVADWVEEKLEESGIVPVNRGSYGSEYWLLMDYADVVVHIFNRESRDFYGIENLWADAKSLDVDELLEKGSFKK